MRRAHVEKRRNVYSVRWREPMPGGGERHRREGRFRRKGEAEALCRLVNRQLAATGRYVAPTAPPSLDQMLDDWIRDGRRRGRAPGTLANRQGAIDRFQRWLGSQDPRDLTREAIEAYFDHLVDPARDGGPSGVGHARSQARLVWSFQRWCYEQRRYRGEMDYPEPPGLPDAPAAAKGVHAATWAQLDLAIASAGGSASWYGRTFVVARFTGLRIGQVLHLRWPDLDMVAGTLHIRPELGKTRAERQGRLVPVSPHLLAQVAGWGRREGWLIDKTVIQRGRPGNPDNRRMHNRRQRAIWENTQVPEHVYAQQPGHVFRKTFITELLVAGVDSELRKYLVGHDLGVHGDVYTDWRKLQPRLREAIAQVPDIGSGNVLPMTARSAAP